MQERIDKSLEEISNTIGRTKLTARQKKILFSKIKEIVNRVFTEVEVKVVSDNPHRNIPITHPNPNPPKSHHVIMTQGDSARGDDLLKETIAKNKNERVF